MKPAARNHLLSYFANGSQINWLISECVRKSDHHAPNMAITLTGQQRRFACCWPAGYRRHWALVQ